MYNQNQQYNNSNKNYQNSSPAKSEVVKTKYIDLIKVFTHFNEHAATINLSIKSNDGTLGISLTPSTLAGTTGKQTVVEKGSKVYDYSREVYTNFTFSEIIQLRDYIKSKLDNKVEDKIDKLNNKIDTMMCAINSLMIKAANEDSSYGEISQYVNNCYNEIITEKQKAELGSQDKNKYGKQNDNRTEYSGIAIHRKTDTYYKLWNFNFAENSTNKDGSENNSIRMFISVTQNNDKNSKIYIMLGEAALIPFYNTLNSYINNKCVIQCACEIFDYVDNEFQLLKSCEFRKMITDIYGQNLENCQREEDRTLIYNMLNAVTEVVTKSIFSTRNLKKYTGSSH